MTQTQGQQSIKLYKTTITKAYMMSEQGTGWSLKPHSSSMYYDGYDDGGALYKLPNDYELNETKYGEMTIFPKNSQWGCPLISHNNMPAILANDGTVIPLMTIG
jgi:hypothetical protein